MIEICERIKQTMLDSNFMVKGNEEYYSGKVERRVN